MSWFSVRDAIAIRIFRILLARRFREFGKGVRILFPSEILGVANISVGDRVYVGHNSTLAALPLTGHHDCSLAIGSATQLGNFNHIYATRRIEIGEGVLTANSVYISDNLHGYQDVKVPIIRQAIRQVGTVKIGDGAWLGHNCCVIGANIGKNSVVGANAVVTQDIPDFSVAVGAPARIIKRFDQEAGVWRATRPDGSFRSPIEVAIASDG